MKPASLILIFLLILANAFITASKQAQIKSKPGKSTERHLDGTEGDTNYIVVYYNDKTEYTNYKEGAAMIKKLKVDGKDVEDKAGKLEITSNLTIYFDESVETYDLSGFFSCSADATDCNEGKITSIDFSNFDFSKVSSLVNLFNGCKSLTSVNFQKSDPKQITDMSSMFEGCTSLASLDLSNLATTKFLKEAK